jgi:ArsR family transcriptional regulator, arsenate/arsenite/antimonite-responsive transcriptional repressor
VLWQEDLAKITTVEQTTQPQVVTCCAPIAPVRLDDEAVQQFTDDLMILAHPIRVQILDLLSRSAGDVCVCDLEAALPVKQPTVSHHLRLLREAGLIDCERRGLWAYYFVQREAVAALRQRIVAQFDAIS